MLPPQMSVCVCVTANVLVLSSLICYQSLMPIEAGI